MATPWLDRSQVSPFFWGSMLHGHFRQTTIFTHNILTEHTIARRHCTCCPAGITSSVACTRPQKCLACMNMHWPQTRPMMVPPSQYHSMGLAYCRACSTPVITKATYTKAADPSGEKLVKLQKASNALACNASTSIHLHTRLYKPAIRPQSCCSGRSTLKCAVYSCITTNSTLLYCSCIRPTAKNMAPKSSTGAAGGQTHASQYKPPMRAQRTITFHTGPTTHTGQQQALFPACNQVSTHTQSAIAATWFCHLSNRHMHCPHHPSHPLPTAVTSPPVCQPSWPVALLTLRQ